jgi:hypothetical protein
MRLLGFSAYNACKLYNYSISMKTEHVKCQLRGHQITFCKGRPSYIYPAIVFLFVIINWLK